MVPKYLIWELDAPLVPRVQTALELLYTFNGSYLLYNYTFAHTTRTKDSRLVVQLSKFHFLQLFLSPWWCWTHWEPLPHLLSSPAPAAATAHTVFNPSRPLRIPVMTLEYDQRLNSISKTPKHYSDREGGEERERKVESDAQQTEAHKRNMNAAANHPVNGVCQWCGKASNELHAPHV